MTTVASARITKNSPKPQVVCVQAIIGIAVALTEIDAPSYLTKIVTKKARTVLTSGGLEPVTDVGGTGHSVFARKFMNALQENQTVIDGHSLFEELKNSVSLAADQTPEYGNIRKAGHDGGDFLFVRQ